MHRLALRHTLCGVVFVVALVPPVAAQGRRASKRPAATPPAPTAVDAARGADSLNNVRFRNLGPSVGGGRVAAVVGIPGQPNVYYVGAGGGGVWKTTDGGDSWDAVFKDQPTASIGAITPAPSNPNLVWVGTGEGNPRNDVVDGRGVFFSPDAGKSWKFMGLGDVGQISRIVVDPANPDIVFVGALGHAWAPNAERGVFRTADGGKTWQKVLFVNDTTGIADLVMAPGNPRVLFAAAWQFVRQPWELVSGGAGSGIYRSTDGGLTWDRLNEGLPAGPFGRIALGIGLTNPNHVYALIEAKQGMLWDSKDLGDHWTRVSDNHALDVRPYYFSLVTVSPADDRKLFFSSFLLLESEDGGKTTRPIDRGVHVDHHALWIDPQNPDRMIQGNDG
ncbi:MAG TPA: glycosyl hydrolase, partial [Gemmatimonadales bacterium]|nr:glycosyl hydrolase [Gemmatimonadales bacterium]